MESSEEEDIIEYDEDDYGEFVIKNNNAILITKGNKSKNQEIVNNSINMGAEPDKLCIKNDGNEKEKNNNIIIIIMLEISKKQIKKEKRVKKEKIVLLK